MQWGHYFLNLIIQEWSIWDWAIITNIFSQGEHVSNKSLWIVCFKKVLTHPRLKEPLITCSNYGFFPSWLIKSARSNKVKKADIGSHLSTHSDYSLKIHKLWRTQIWTEHGIAKFPAYDLSKYWSSIFLFFSFIHT